MRGEEEEEVQRGLDGGRNPQLSKHFTTRTALLHVQRQNTLLRLNTFLHVQRGLNRRPNPQLQHVLQHVCRGAEADAGSVASASVQLRCVLCI